MAEERAPFMRSIKPDRVYPGAKITIEGDCLEMVTKVLIHNVWASFTKDRGKLKVEIPDIGAPLCVVTLGWPAGRINNRACGLQPLKNMSGGFSPKESTIEEKPTEPSELIVGAATE